MVPNLIDSVYIYAHALDKLINDHCSGINNSDLHACVRRHDLFSYMKKVSFQGLSEYVSFDSNGDAFGEYIIDSVKSLNNNIKFVPVGTWSRQTNQLVINQSAIDWNRFLHNKHQAYNSSVVPDSVCSYPCGVGEVQVPQELHCCWECTRCRSNELIAGNGTRCESCPPLAWPDQETRLSCYFLQPRFLALGDWLGTLLFAGNWKKKNTTDVFDVQIAFSLPEKLRNVLVKHVFSDKFIYKIV